MKIKKIVALLVTLAMCIGLLTVPVMAEGDVWDGITVDTTWYNETDTEFILSTGAQLAGLAKLVNEGNTFNAPVGNDTNAKTIKLGADIDLGGKEWTPIGTASHPFRGYFDGQNYTIKNLKITQPDMEHVGLFGYWENLVVINNTTQSDVVVYKDLTIENVDITGKKYVGAFAGTSRHETCENITVKGSIKISGGAKVGGVLGQSYTNCRNITVEGTGNDNYIQGTGKGDSVGGVVGYMRESGIGNIYLDNVKVSNITIIAKGRVGGAVGSAYLDNYITNSEVSNVTIEAIEGTEIGNAELGIGGVVGTYYTAAGRRDGKIDTVSVSDITLIDNTNNENASFGYITGGEAGTTAPVKPTFESESAAADITVNGTNSGENNIYLYNLADILYVDAYVDSQDKGNIRFITKVNSDDTVTAYGTYFVLEKDIENIQQSDVKLEGNSTGKKTTFGADIMGVPENKLNEKIYAISFIKIGDKDAVWSPVKGATVDEYNHNKEVNE